MAGLRLGSVPITDTSDLIVQITPGFAQRRSPVLRASDASSFAGGAEMDLGVEAMAL